MTAPNEKIFSISEKEKLSEVIEKIGASLPAMPDAVWSVDTGTKTIAYHNGDKEPEGIVNKKGVFSVKNASEVLWTWYLYGEKQIYRNLYVRRYAKQDDGSILRAEGKRRDVKQDSGAPFRIKGQYAVLIE